MSFRGRDGKWYAGWQKEVAPPQAAKRSEAAGPQPQPPMRFLEAAGWIPAVPLRAPVDVRWHCSHEWTAHAVVHKGKLLGYSHVDYDCLRCGATTEAGTHPEDGFYGLRKRIARRLWRRK